MIASRGDETVQRFPSRDALLHAAAECIVQEAATAIAHRGRFVIALSGGVTPVGVYELLASPLYARQVKWDAVHVCFGDERCVPPGDGLSNYRMASTALLDHVPIPATQVHRMRGEDHPATAAAAYEHELRTLFHTPDGIPRINDGQRFDLVLLGLGADGHTASLFPNQSAVRESTHWVVADTKGSTTTRLTLTPPLINAAAHVVFLVSGADKADAVQQVREGPRDIDHLPAQSIAPTHGALHWMLDLAAAAKLRTASDQSAPRDALH